MELSAVGGSYPRCLPYVAGAGTCDELTCSGSTCHSSELPLATCACYVAATWLHCCWLLGSHSVFPTGDYKVVLGWPLVLGCYLKFTMTSRAWAASNGTAQTTSARASESWRTYSEALLSGAISAELTAELLEYHQTVPRAGGSRLKLGV